MPIINLHPDSPIDSESLTAHSMNMYDTVNLPEYSRLFTNFKAKSHESSFYVWHDTELSVYSDNLMFVFVFKKFRPSILRVLEPSESPSAYSHCVA